VKILKQGLSLALLGAGLAAVPGLQAAAAENPRPAAESLVQQMKSTADGSVAISSERATGKVGFVRARGNGDLMPSVKGDTMAAAIAKANAYVKKYGAAFGASGDQLKQSEVRSGRYGWTISYTQEYQGLTVFGARIKANLDKAGDLTSVNGYAAPGLNLSTTPRLGKDEAASRAIATVRVNPPTSKAGSVADTSDLRAVGNELMIYRTGSIKGETGKAVLAYIVEVSNKRNIRDSVFVDANTGKVLNRYSMNDSADFATHRELYEADPDRVLTKVWEDGDAFPGTLNEDQQSMVLPTGNSYWLYANTFGRDSYDGAGAIMRTVNNDPAIECPNANWNGATTNYCDGVSSDDVVSHEWGHAYTEYTSGLIYQWQPGALNESYSDVWGETVDLINNRLDGDEGDLTAKRPVGQCSTHSPATPLLTINAPSSIAKECLTGGLLGTLTAPITGDVVIPTDVADEGGTTTDGCSTYDNPAAAAGKIVLVDRGLCTFVQKAEVARDAGAAAVIIGNRDDSPVSFSSDDNTLPTTVSIGLADREAIRAALAGGETVNVTIEDTSGQRVDSYRWLMGEDSAAFGGAIRDMWSPTCYGDPGKVSDAEYKCATDDSGGVHGNSGVPNHGYALLVDGGTYNGVTVAGIGLDKAANIFWRTQTDYLTPTSDFADMADGLDAACTALVGQPISQLSVKRETPGAAAEPITAADCAAVTAMEKAVELRKAPTQCNFEPLLNPNAPSACGKKFTTKTVWKEDFEKGLDKWKKGETLVYPEGHGFPWRATQDVPGKHDSKVAYGPAPDAGDCSGAANDISSANTIKSKGVLLPGGSSRRLTFQHYMASEAGYDGGNVKISVNGGKFTVIPASAYVFNKPNATIATVAEQNTNPLAGQEGFTGTNGGEVFGSWGTSIVDLKAAGARVGDKVKFRFDMGRDGCGGIDGWYLDNVKVLVCQKKDGNKQVAGTTRRSTVKR
jgi:Zn-dependent metalloprotease